MGASASHELTPEAAAVAVAEHFVRSAVVQLDELLPAATAHLLHGGALSNEVVERIRLEGRGAASSAAARDEHEIASLAPALLQLDPLLARARHLCVPSRLPEAAWWALYHHTLLTAAAQQLPLLLQQERACRVLRELAGAPLRSDGGLSQLPASVLWRVASHLPAASVLSLGGASRALFPLGHADVWRHLVARDFPDVAPGLPTGRAQYEAVARGRHGVPPGAAEAVDAYLRAGWGGRCCVYGGWGSPHLEVTMLWRGAAAAALRATFEYKLDDGETVWGERAEEELLLVAGGGSWAAMYAQGRPMAVEPLHGSLRGPPPPSPEEEAAAPADAKGMEMEVLMTAPIPPAVENL